MGKNMKSELYKLVHGKALYFMMLAGVFAGMCTSVTIWSSFQEAGWQNFNFLDEMYNNTTVYIGYIIIFLLVTVAAFATTEFSNDTIKNILFIGTSRTQFILTKIVICEIVLLVTIAVMFLTQCVSLKIFAGNNIDVAATYILKTIIILTLKFNLMYLPIISVTMLVACMSQNIIATIAIGYGVNVVQSMLILALDSLGLKNIVNKVFLVQMKFFYSEGYNENLYIACIASFAWLAFWTILVVGYFKKKDLSAH